MDRRFSNIVIEYHHENEKVRETVLAQSCGAKRESFEQKNRGRKSRDTDLIDRILRIGCLWLCKRPICRIMTDIFSES